MATMSQTRRVPVLNLPNLLTFGRFGLALVLFGLIAQEWWAASLIVFAVAAFTDWLDGYLARLHNLTSDLGRNLDPLVDKILMCGAYVFLLPLGYKDGWLQPWMVTVIVGRELIITSLRSFVETQGTRFGADWLGKFKMVLQCAALLAIFVELQKLVWLAPLGQVCLWLRDGLIYAMLTATLLSGLQYIWRAAALIRTDTTA
jgi:CDP-diacylglycerol---glycerol-3-phosphate 3-phosphatidyltransferase